MNTSTQALTTLKSEIDRENREIQLKEQELKRKEDEIAKKEQELQRLKNDAANVKLHVDELKSRRAHNEQEIKKMQEELHKLIDAKAPNTKKRLDCQALVRYCVLRSRVFMRP